MISSYLRRPRKSTIKDSKLLQRTKESGLTLNKDKCCFKMAELEFMGHVLSANGIAPEEAKVKAVSLAKEPKSATEVRSFLGLVNYCGRFIPDFATISEPLRKLTRKGAVFKWDKSQRESFRALKHKLCNAPVLGYFEIM